MGNAADRRTRYEEWQEMAPRWERGRELLWESTRPVSEWLVARLDAQPGQTILDLAAGTGETGFLAAGRLGPGGRLISSDLSPGMVEAAERVAAVLGVVNAEFRVLDAEHLELEDDAVDGVLCRFGYILRGDPPPALREIRRVLRPGGRLAFSAWAERERNPWMTVPSEVMAERGHLGPRTAAEIRLSERRNPEAIAGLVREAGFAEPEIEEMPVAYRFADAEELWYFVSELRGPVALALDRLDEAERAAVRRGIEARATPVPGGGYELGGISLNVVAD
jgi:ubiquinone/menaquinone biosynthesis C-methylase UbiE